MNRRMARIAVVLGLSGCGDAEPLESAEQGEVCGEPGPVRLLELDEDEMAAAAPSVRVGDRVYFVVGGAVSASDAPFMGPFGEGPWPTHPRLMSVGTCGESPRTIGDDVISVFTDPRWPGAVLGASAAQQGIHVLDPEGVLPPRVLVPALPHAARSDAGLVGIVPDGTRGRAVLQPFPATAADAPPAQIELMRDVVDEFGAIAAVGNEVFVLGIDRKLHAIDLAAPGDPATVASSVSSFAVSSDGRRVLLVGTSGSNGRRDASVLDRESSTLTKIGGVASYWQAFTTGSDDIVVELDESEPFGARLVSLATLQIVDVERGVRLMFRIDEGTFLSSIDGEYASYRLSDGGTTTLLEKGKLTDFGADALEFLEDDDPSVGSQQRTSPLWRVRYADGVRERLADRAARGYTHLDDDRVITPVTIDRDFLGTLVVVDPGDLTEARIDDRVVSVRADLAPPDAFEPGVIAYGVRDGARSGIWLAKPE